MDDPEFAKRAIYYLYLCEGRYKIFQSCVQYCPNIEQTVNIPFIPLEALQPHQRGRYILVRVRAKSGIPTNAKPLLDSPRELIGIPSIQIDPTPLRQPLRAYLGDRITYTYTFC